MSNFIPQWMIGKNVQLTITPQTVSATTGQLTAGTPITFLGVLSDDGISSETTFITNPVSPMDCGYENDVDMMVSTTYNMSELMQNNGVSSGTLNKLDHIARICRYAGVLITCNDSAGTAHRTENAICKWNRYNPNFRKGDTKGLMTWKTVAVGDGSGAFQANPVLADS